ncbi:MAG: inorganic phosphate transporter [Burkholderiales bacterium]|nr:inorganic phosphate transporter [Burkholderiales bacterium]
MDSSPATIPLLAQRALHERFRLIIAFLFILCVMVYAIVVQAAQGGIMVVVAAMVGAYMAMNIGANDVANNVGPAVGAKAMPLVAALIIASIFEALGALIAGSNVVDTIRGGIIIPGAISDPDTFIWLMLGSLFAGAVWLNIATYVGAPVSTTHSIVGAVLGGGLAASGLHAINFPVLINIILSWVVSPLLGGLFAAAFLYTLKYLVVYKDDKAEAARRLLPLLMFLMVWAFTTYLLLKSLSNIWKIDFVTAVAIGFLLGSAFYLWLRRRYLPQNKEIINTKYGVNQLFSLPLIFAAALLSFAHGSNDVSNAIGPLAAIVDTVRDAHLSKSVGIPFWVMVIGAIGISLGLVLFGAKLIRTLGSEITELDQMRAFCIAMAAAITVIVASQFGLPVSSTHIAVGGIFGVGFLREYLKTNYAQMLEEIREHYPEEERSTINDFMERFEKATVRERGIMLRKLKRLKKDKNAPAVLSKSERKNLRSVYKEELIKRSLVIRIAAAWLITVPASALLSAMFFFMLRGMLLP